MRAAFSFDCRVNPPCPAHSCPTDLLVVPAPPLCSLLAISARFGDSSQMSGALSTALHQRANGHQRMRTVCQTSFIQHKVRLRGAISSRSQRQARWSLSAWAASSRPAGSLAPGSPSWCLHTSAVTWFVVLEVSLLSRNCEKTGALCRC